MSAIIQYVRLKMVLPVTCCKCGAQQMSESIEVETRDISPHGLLNAISAQRVGTHFPVGWSSNLRDGKTVYDCPQCVRG